MTLELLPYGQEKAKKFIKRIEIINDGWHKNPVQYANYKINVYDNPHTEVKPKLRYITDYPREKYDATYLLYLVLRKYVHEDKLIEPIDPKAERDREASAGPGHSLVQDGVCSVGGPGYHARSPYGRGNY